MARRTRRRVYHKRRRTYRRNPRRNGRAITRTITGGIGRLTKADTWRVVGWGTAGAIASRMLPGMFLARFDQGWMGWLLNAASALTLGAVSRPLVGTRAAAMIATGGLISTGIRMASETVLAGQTPFGEYTLEGGGAGEYVPEAGEVAGGMGMNAGQRFVHEANAF